MPALLDKNWTPSVGLNLRIEAKMDGALRRWSKDTDISISKLCRVLLEEGLEVLDKARRGGNEEPVSPRISNLVDKLDAPLPKAEIDQLLALLISEAGKRDTTVNELLGD